MDATTMKANNCLDLFLRNLASCPQDVKVQCYTTLVRPIPKYVTSAMDPLTTVTLGFLRCNFRDCTIQVKRATYMMMVRPSLEYVSTVWDPVSQKHILLLEHVQYCAAIYSMTKQACLASFFVIKIIKAVIYC